MKRITLKSTHQISIKVTSLRKIYTATIISFSSDRQRFSSFKRLDNKHSLCLVATDLSLLSDWSICIALFLIEITLNLSIVSVQLTVKILNR